MSYRITTLGKIKCTGSSELPQVVHQNRNWTQQNWPAGNSPLARRKICLDAFSSFWTGQALLKTGVIWPSKSQWALPVVCAKTRRSPQINYRDLNWMTPTHASHQRYHRVSGTSKVHLNPLPRQGILPCSLGKRCNEEKAEWELWVYKAFGLHSAPAAFQCLMNMVLDRMHSSKANIIMWLSSRLVTK